MNQSRKWSEIVTNIAEIHTRKSMENPGWTLDDTRRISGYSLGYVSESLKLARALKDNPKLLECPDRETALSRLRPKQEIFPNNTKVVVKVGNTFEPGVIIGRGTVLPRDIVWIIKLDHPFFFERASKRMDIIVAKTADVREYE